MPDTKYTIYRIWYGDSIVYVGRTKQPLQSRIRGHLFAKPMHRVVAIEQVSKIEYAELDTEADMNLYEIYYILKYKPCLNVDDKTKDTLTVSLPELEWREFYTTLWEKWTNTITEKRTEHEKMSERYRVIPQELRVLRSKWKMGELSEDEFYEQKDRLMSESDSLRQKLYGRNASSF